MEQQESDRDDHEVDELGHSDVSFTSETGKAPTVLQFAVG
jgi:hypothetical protein